MDNCQEKIELECYNNHNNFGGASEMKKTNIIDDVMNYIDDNIKQGYNKLKKGIQANFGYDYMDFHKFLSIITEGEISLNKYIIRRRLFFAAKELIDLPEKTIVNIALDYGYSEQSSFSRAMKNEYKVTPNQIRKSGEYLPDEKISYGDFDVQKGKWGKRLKDAITMVVDSDSCFCEDYDYFETFINATNEYHFDTSTCYAISEVSERLGIPFSDLLNTCFDMMINFHSSPDYIDPKIEKAIDCGISSDEELDEICDFYNCEYYQLNRDMVDEFKEQKGI